ncbi:unnamed protein product [Acanthoscelides obtectus]|nr:unnamed protein product [Acanthoscelides obtectus]CAK1626879.1 Fibroblast growth factor receptor homolog 2 [Acanthoscelides obtectus]
MSGTTSFMFIVISTSTLVQASYHCKEFSMMEATFCCYEFALFHEESGNYIKLYAFIYGKNIRINISLEEVLEPDDALEIFVTDENYEYRGAQDTLSAGNYMVELTDIADVNLKKYIELSLPQLNISRELNLACPEVCCVICSSMVADITNVTMSGQYEYLLSVSTNTSSNLEIMTINYNNIITGLSHKASNWTVDDKGIEFTMDTLQDGGRYDVDVIYFDQDNEYCKDSVHTTLEVPARPDRVPKIKLIIIVLLLLLTGMTTIIILKYGSRILAVILKIRHLFSNADIVLDVPSFPSPAKVFHNVLYEPVVPPRRDLKDSYDFPREKIEHVRVLGQGEFGIVYESKAWRLNGRRGYTMVAVKVLKECIPQNEIAEFRHEIDMQKKIGNHKNVIRMLGCVTLTQPMMIIMELVPTGNLKDYFRKLRDIWSGADNRRFFGETSFDGQYIQPDGGQSASETIQNVTEADKGLETENLDDLIHCDSADSTPLFEKEPEPALDHKELENFAYQIACGMAHLENKGIVHRDLAARNILITHNKTLKVSDFGMSRQGTYITYRLKKIPLRWKALEFLEQFKDDSKTDVWAYGVVLWEIGTLGAFPYEEIHNDNILAYLQAGNRLAKPITCTDAHYQVMMSCWERDPCKRPTFADIRRHFAFTKNHAYVDFSGINPSYVFPPMCDKEGNESDIKDVTG